MKRLLRPATLRSDAPACQLHSVPPDPSQLRGGWPSSRTARILRAPVALTGLLLAAVVASPAPPPVPPLREERFSLTEPGEVVATITASCARCSWQETGQKTAMLRLTVDDRYAQHLVLLRGGVPAPYAVLLGALPAGFHRLRLELDRRASAPDAGAVSVSSIVFRTTTASDPAYAALARAPILYRRPGTFERFSDLPLVVWYETDRTRHGTRYRYSVVFTNEDGGTPVDRLMATWGRTTDIEFAYAVEVDADGQVLEETYQADGHEIEEFRGRHEDGHPLLWVVTDNNLFGLVGPTAERTAPAPIAFELANVSREAVMDAQPWTYRVAAQEVRREGKVSPDARPGEKRIPDPRRFAFLEACAPGTDATLTFELGVAAGDAVTWFRSDAGEPRYRIARSASTFPNGCFRVAVALPEGTTAAQVRGLRFLAHTREPAKDEPPLPEGTGRAHLVRVNRLFLLGPDDLPGPSLFAWTGDVPLVGEGPAAELPVSPR